MQVTLLVLTVSINYRGILYICYCSKNSQYYGVSSENKKLLFNLPFGCPKAKFDLDVLNKNYKNYMLTMVLLHCCNQLSNKCRSCFQTVHYYIYIYIYIYICVKSITIFYVEFTKKMILFFLFTPQFFIRKFISLLHLK